MSLELRPYQVEAIASARRELAAGRRAVLLVSPTGSGKTVIASSIIRSAVQRGSRTLFLAHRRELIAQTADKLRRFGVRYGVIMAGERMALQESCQVASIQTLANRRNALQDVDLIFFDEAHHAAAATYQEVLRWFPRARVVGLTATPWRQDGRGLADTFDASVVVTTPLTLLEAGFLAPVGGWAYEAIDTRGAKVRGGDYVASSLAQAALSRVVLGDVVKEYLEHAAGKRAVVFATTVEASQQMALAFRAAGVRAEHVDANTPKPERDAMLARLRTGETPVICNCGVLTEGFDCPELEVAILARPTLSVGLYLQMVGRVLRTAPGKAMARIHDHAGLIAKHGHPYLERDYTPAPGESINATREEPSSGAGPSVAKKCPACGSVRLRWPCDACGHTPTPAQLAIEHAVRRRAIELEKAKALQADKEAKRRELAAQFSRRTEEERHAFYLRMVAKHGPRKAVSVFRWWSGETAWPPREWRGASPEAAEALAAGGGR